MNAPAVTHHQPETVALADLREHPRNYRTHPADQLDHLKQSLQAHGLYRNVVVAEDGTILAGHGVVQAAQQLGLTEIQVVRLPISAESPAALQVLTGDNEIEHLAEQDDRALTELLKELATLDPLALLGTGYDEPMLANLAMVTRPKSEIEDFDAAAHWAGMPEYEPSAEDAARLRLVVSFREEADRADFYHRLGVVGPTGTSASLWWPPRGPDDDVQSVLLTDAS